MKNTKVSIVEMFTGSRYGMVHAHEKTEAMILLCIVYDVVMVVRRSGNSSHLLRTKIQ